MSIVTVDDVSARVSWVAVVFPYENVIPVVPVDEVSTVDVDKTSSPPVDVVASRLATVVVVVRQGLASAPSRATAGTLRTGTRIIKTTM